MRPEEMFGACVFNDSAMKKYLPRETYKALRLTRVEGHSLKADVASVVANAMKEWAMEMGATHYTHWFQPMTGVTAEKHDAFLSPAGEGRAITEFSGKELVSGESDASSFPSGGLRGTFEARGYTAWDPTSDAFVRDKVLYVPTAFCSYGGQALDKKTPLLRSMEALNRQALRILHLFGHHEVVRVFPTVGAEQEYFLLDKAAYLKRPDLIAAGHTLFGSPPCKGQEMDDHYCGAIKPRVQAFMNDLNEELWKLGVAAKTEHNETAPAQHELAPVYGTANIAADHNQITMECMKRIADRHGLVCLLHEKPFNGMNGSGKHNNYGLCTDTGINLLDPGETPAENAQFLLFLTAMIAAVDDYQELLRVSVASAGNDYRLGSNEAPPAIVSIFLGEELNRIIESILHEETYQNTEHAMVRLGVHILPKIPKDSTDRNRTSPFAFTGNKFEFRSPGASQSVSGPNVVINTALADTLEKMADELEKALDLTASVNAMIRRMLQEHSRILFDGNGYGEAWIQEAARRGLSNLPTTADALPSYISDKNIALFERQKVYTREEVQSRYEIKLNTYIKTIEMEARCMTDMARRMVLPAALQYSKFLAEEIAAKKAVGLDIPVDAEKEILLRLSSLTQRLCENGQSVEQGLKQVDGIADSLEKARTLRDELLPAMGNLRACADTLETIVPKNLWPMPDYQDLITSV